MRIMTLGASNSRRSINAELARHAGELLVEIAAPLEVELDDLDLNDYEMPIYGEDREAANGIPVQAQAFLDRVANADAIVVSFAEHNGTFSVAFKNVLDWASRVTKRIWQDTPIVVLATSPGPGGARSVLNQAVTSTPFFGGDLRGHLSVPSFHDVWDPATRRLLDHGTAAELRDVLEGLLGSPGATDLAREHRAA